MKNRICEILGIEKPVVQGPMVWLTDAKLVAAVSNAGGLGSLGPNAGQTTVTRDPVETAERMRQSVMQSASIKVLQLFNDSFYNTHSSLASTLSRISITKPVIDGNVCIGQRFDWFFFRIAGFVYIIFVGVASAETFRTKAEVLRKHYPFGIFQTFIGFVKLAIKLQLTVEEIIREIFERIKGVPKSAIINSRYKEELAVRKANSKRLQSEYAKELEKLNKLREEVVKSIQGESAFSQSMLAGLVEDSEKKAESLKVQCEKAESKVESSKTLIKDLNDQYDEIISWSSLYDSASDRSKENDSKFDDQTS